MGRTLSESAAAVGTVPANIVTIKTINDLAIGDVVATGTSGKVVYVAPTNTNPNRILNDTIIDKVSTPLGATGYSHPPQGVLKNHIIFDSGEEFLAYTGNGSSDSTNAGYYNFGTGIKTDIVTTTGLYTSALEKLDESSFLYLSTTINYGSLQFTIRQKNGTTIIKALTVLAAINTFETIDMSSNGIDRIAIVYQTNSGSYLSLLDYSGNIVGSAIQLTTNGSGCYTKVKFLANGNILVLYSKGNSGTYTKQFTKAGVIIGTELQLSTYVSAHFLLGSSCTRLIQSVENDIYVLSPDDGNGYLKIHKISATNTLITSIYPFLNNTPSYTGDILITADRNILVARQYAGSLRLSLFTKELVIIKQSIDIPVSAASTSSLSSTNNLYVSEVANGYCVFNAGCGSTHGASLMFVTTNFLQNGTDINLVINSGATINASVYRNKKGIWLTGAYAVNENRMAVRLIQAGKQSILGIATSVATAGGDASVLVEGEATLSGDYSLVGVFDLRTSVPYGNRGIVVGNKGVMFGLKV